MSVLQGQDQDLGHYIFICEVGSVGPFFGLKKILQDFIYLTFREVGSKLPFLFYLTFLIYVYCMFMCMFMYNP